MTDLVDKAILIGMGLEKKAREALDELEKLGKKSADAASAAKAGEGLTPKQVAENKVVEEGTRALKDFIAMINASREKLEKEISGTSGKILDKFNVATRDDVEVIKEMARVAREKVDALEKRVTDLENSVYTNR